MTRPMYMILKNTTAYEISRLNITMDNDNIFSGVNTTIGSNEYLVLGLDFSQIEGSIWDGVWNNIFLPYWFDLFQGKFNDFYTDPTKYLYSVPWWTP